MRDGSINCTRNNSQGGTLDEYSVEMVTPPLNYEDIDLLQKLHSASALVNSVSFFISFRIFALILRHQRCSLCEISRAS